MPFRFHIDLTRSVRAGRWLPCAAAWSLAISSPATASEGQQEWTNREGRSMTAEIVGYDQITKTVAFRKVDGMVYRYPLEDIDFKGKVRVMGSPEFSRTLAAWTPPLGILIGILMVWACVLLLLLFSMDLASTWGAAWLVAREPQFWKAFRLWVKIILLSISIAVVSGIVGGIYGAFSGSMEAALRGGTGVGFVFNLVQYVGCFVLVSGHYEIGFLRSVAFLVANALGRGLGVLLLLALLYAVIEIEPISDLIFVKGFLKPIGLV